jgi:hypothetical protein
MRPLFLIMLLAVLLSACQNKKKENLQPGVCKGEVIEVLPAGGDYTYLKMNVDGKERWLAVDAMEAQPGNTFYYKEGFPMIKFESKELKRTFDTIFFVSEISNVPFPDKSTAKIDPATAHSGMAGQKDNSIKIEPVAGGITIAKLFSDKKSYDGKTVLIKGQVTKFSPQIMNKNWIHIQDATEANGLFDLTVTSNIEVTVGDVVTLEGKISLNKDFGFGYSYEVIMEDAVLK